ncbi:branched-chain amino acid aminotransferase [Bacteroidia bacterium]|nr:branched-chain amino acid aminotransferase [Bacteroidia bacterium]
MQIDLVSQSKINTVDFNQLDFGKTFTDYMMVMDFDGESWSGLTIEPINTLNFHPAMSVFHYGQAIFEGLKAFKATDNRVNIFRLNDNLLRFNKSAERLMMPLIDIPTVSDAIKKFIDMQRDWVPSRDQGSLYLRPFMISTDNTLRAVSSSGFKFVVIACPVGFYYAEPISIIVDKNYRRAATGGIGFAKAAGNYAASFYPSKLAKEKGFDQVLWTDITNNFTLEELGSANFFFVKNGELYTPKMRDSILNGITRNTVIHLAKESGMMVHEAEITADEFKKDLNSGSVDCVFATGTAAAITYIHKIMIDEETFHVKSNMYAPVNQLHKDLEDAKFGLKNHEEWNVWV